MKLEKIPGGYALYKEKTIIGTCQARPTEQGADITALTIVPEWRRKGYGSYLLKEVLRSLGGYDKESATVFILIREWFSFGRVIEMDKEGCTVKWRNRSKEYRWSELKTRRIENNIKSCYTNCRKCAVISPYEIKRFRKKDPMSYFINILHWRDWSTFYVYLDSGKINDGKNSYEGGINESIFRGKIAQWGVTFDDVNLKKVKPWEEIL